MVVRERKCDRKSLCRWGRRSGEMSSLSLNSPAGLEPRGLQLPYVSLIKVNTLDPGLVHTCNPLTG